MPARSEMGNDTIERNLGGDISVRKSASPTETGTASTSAIALVTSVPYTYGKAPYVSRTTSHCDEVMKRTMPTVAKSGFATRHSSATMSAATTRTVTPRTLREAPHARSARLWRLRGVVVLRPGRATLTMSLAGCKDRFPLDGEFAQRALYLADDRRGQRGVLQGGRKLLAVMCRPPEELQQSFALGCVGHVLVDEKVGERRDGPGILARLIGDRDAVIVRDLRLRGRGRNRFQARLHPRSVVVLHLRDRQLVLIRVRQFDVSNAAFVLLDEAGDALVALAAEASRPVDALAGSRTALPLRRDLAQVIGERVRRAGTVRAVRDGNGRVGELRSWIVFRERRIVPVGDLAQEDSGQCLRSQPQRLQSRHVVDEHHRSHDGRDVLDALGPGKLLVAHRRVARAEIDGLLRDLFDAAAGADRLVVDLHLRVHLVVRREPFRIEREREGRAGSVDEKLACAEDRKGREGEDADRQGP